MADGKVSGDELSTGEGGEVALPNADTPVAVPNTGSQVALPNPNTQVAVPNTDNQVALPASENDNQGSQSEITITGGDYRGASLGPKTNNKVVQVKEYNQSTVIENYYYVTGESEQQEPSTSGMQPPKRRRVENTQCEEGYKQISDDVFMYTKEPLREGTKIFQGYQKHVSGRIPVAIKRILDCKDSNVREVENLVTVSAHPNVVRIIQSKETDGDVRILYIVMELCSKKNLHDYMEENRKKKNPFNYKKTMAYSKQLVNAMRHIHANRIAHRDMKPENVLLSEDEERIKISDFGLGKKLATGRSKTKASVQGQGTEGYRAPEAMNTDVVAMPADVYSTGLTLFGLWSHGKHVYGDDILLRDYNIVNNTGRDFSGLLISGIKRDELLDLLDRMLQFDPRLRPTMEEVARDVFFAIEAPQVQEDNLGAGTSGTVQQQEAQVELEETTAKEPGSSDNATPIDRRTFFAPEEEASRLFKERKFQDVITMLADLQPSKRQQKLLAECYFRVGKDEEAVKCMDTLKVLVISSEDRPKPDDVIKDIEGFIDTSLSLHALIHIPSAAELSKIDSAPDDAFWQLVLCAWRGSDVVKNLYQEGGRMRVVSKTVGIDLMHRIWDILRGINGGNVDRKVDMEARCINDIAAAFYAIENYNKAMEFYHRGIALMKDHFNENSKKYSVMQRLHMNLAASQYKLGNYRESENNFGEALKMADYADDYPNAEEREKVKHCIKENLKVLRLRRRQAENN